MECWSIGVMNYETELRNKNRGYMKLIVWQKAMELFRTRLGDRFHGEHD